jgi:hypothetical protein
MHGQLLLFNCSTVAVNECICLLTLSMMYCKGIVKLSCKAGTDCCANTWIQAYM